MHLFQCQNCLTSTVASTGECSVCGFGAELLSIHFSDEARTTIAQLGGIYGGLSPIGAGRDVMVWCETGLFRFQQGQGVVWVVQAGLVDSVYVSGDQLRLSSGGVETNVSLATGTAV
jgi:hypothetical protein